MVPVLNLIGTNVACVGVSYKLPPGEDTMADGVQNHDLDFGVKQFRSLAQQCDFPWLLANVYGS